MENTEYIITDILAVKFNNSLAIIGRLCKWHVYPIAHKFYIKKLQKPFTFPSIDGAAVSQIVRNLKKKFKHFLWGFNSWIK